MKIKEAIVHWHLNDRCGMGCEYCPARYHAGTNNKTVEEYLTVIEKLQISRYKNAESIKWKLGGGEPIELPGLSQLLKKIKTGPSFVRLDTSGGNSWFDLVDTKDFVDHYNITHHHWQNESVLNFIIDFCKENQKKITVIVPLNPGRIIQDREKVNQLNTSGIEAYEKILLENNQVGNYWSGYSRLDINRIESKPDDWVEEDKQPTEPVYVDLSKAPEDDSIPSYTGLGCYAGVDYIYISGRGYASGSDCNGRDLGNVFLGDWVAPDSAFACCVNYCRSDNDRKRLRVGIKP